MNQQTGATVVKYFSYILFVNAIIWGLAPFPIFDAPARLYLDMLYWPIGDGLPVWNQNLIWFSAIGAGLLIALAIVYRLIVYPAVLEGNHSIVRAAIIAGIAWFIVDSAGSIAAGVFSNAVINLITLIPLIGPLLIIRFDQTA